MLSKVKKSAYHFVSIPPVVDVRINTRNDSNDDSEVLPLTFEETGRNPCCNEGDVRKAAVNQIINASVIQ